MYYKSIREEISRTNIGPGSYNLEYSWRTDVNNNSHFPSVSSETGPSSPNMRGSPKCAPGQYERPWLAEKSIPAIGPREQQLNKIHTAEDIESVKSLPSY